MHKIMALIMLMGLFILPHNIVLADNGEMDYHNLGKSSVFYEECDFILADPYNIYFTNVGMTKDEFVNTFAGTGLWKNLHGDNFTQADFIQEKNSENVYLIRNVKDGLVLFTGVFKDNKLVMSVVQMYSNNLKRDLAPLYQKTALMYAYLTKATEENFKDYKIANKDASLMINTATQNIILSINSGTFPTVNGYNGAKYKYGLFITHVDNKYKM